MSNELSTRNAVVQSDTQPALSPDDFVKELRALRERIPMPELVPMPAGTLQKLAHVNADFVNASVSAVGVSDAIRVALGRNDEDLRGEIDAVGRWATGIDEVRALLQRMVTDNTVRKQRIGLAALQTYKISQQLARDHVHRPRLEVHIREMKRLNRFGKARRKPATEPQPQPGPDAKT